MNDDLKQAFLRGARKGFMQGCVSGIMAIPVAIAAHLYIQSSGLSFMCIYICILIGMVIENITNNLIP